MAVRVLLAEDEEMVRRGIRLCLEQGGIDIVGEASNGLQALELIVRHDPDVAVFDLIPDLTGIEAARQVFREHRRTRTILLTVRSDRRLALEALRAGALGYVLKAQPIDDLISAIHTVARGERYLSPSLGADFLRDLIDGTELCADFLSARERQVLQLIAEGHSTKGTADVLGISVKTAGTHRTRIMKKLDIHATADLVRYAIRHGLTQP